MAPCGWMVALGVGKGMSDLVASSNRLAFLPRRALPVMYAVALDLRIFANNVSSVFVTILLKLKLSFCCLISCHLPKVLRVRVWVSTYLV